MNNPSLPVPLDRPKGLLMGLIGGAVGVLAMQVYWRMLSRNAFLQVKAGTEPVAAAQRLPEIQPVFGQQARPGESATATVGRIVYARLTGHEPDTEARRQLRLLVLLTWGMAMGAVYGFTRTTTRWRDIAGGFFFGLRLWMGNELTVGFLGLRRDPRRWSLQRHLVWLTGHWVYSFVATNLTRVLYRLL